MAHGSFRGRLFLLLLIFAAVPVILLTLAGYYLVVGTPLQDRVSDKAALQRLNDYYVDLIYRDLAARVNEYLSRPETKGLDFVVFYTADTASVMFGDSTLSLEAAYQIADAARQRGQGLTESGGRLYQYVSAGYQDSGFMAAGIVHDSALAALIDEFKVSGARTTTQRELRGRYVVFVGGFLLSMMTVTLMAAWYFSSRASRRLADPLIALSRASERIARGEFRETVNISAEGEIGRLVQSFNRMAGRLDEATARLAQTERVAAWRQVARRFAHELKNPLQPILVSLYRIEKQLADTPQWVAIREPLQAAAAEVKHLTELADRFSGLAKLPPPKTESIDLNAVVRSVAELYHEKLRTYSFSTDLPDKTVRVVFDESYLREAIHNLLQNAADACRERDEISIRVVDEPDRALLIVNDSGSGMDAATLAAARLPYFTTKEKGTGLGLAIVDKFMTELGGRLQVESAPGVGTAATLVLPKESPHAR